jgi:hypothetical protein
MINPMLDDRWHAGDVASCKSRRKIFELSEHLCSGRPGIRRLGAIAVQEVGPEVLDCELLSGDGAVKPIHFRALHPVLFVHPHSLRGESHLHDSAAFG